MDGSAARRWTRAALPVVAVAGAHLAILAVWWGALRWVMRGAQDRAAAVSAFAAVIVVETALVIRARRHGKGIDGALVTSRVLATSVFVALLTSLEGTSRRWLIVHFALVALPYLVAVRWSAFRPFAGASVEKA
jgi:hypothetical protein